MGGGASAQASADQVSAAIKDASPADVAAALAQLSAEDRAKILGALDKADTNFPTEPGQVTKEWLSAQLPGRTVASFEISKVGMGFTSDAHKIEAKFEDGSAETLILKVPSGLGLEKQKQHAKDCKIEVLFYRELSKEVPLRCCKAHSTSLDDAQPWRWNLLLENLATGEDAVEFPLWFGNDTIYPDPNIWTVIVPAVQDDLAKLHAKFWKSPVLDSAELFKVQPAREGMKLSFAIASTGAKVWEPFVRPWSKPGKTCGQVLFEDCLTPEIFAKFNKDGVLYDPFTDAGTEMDKFAHEYRKRIATGEDGQATVEAILRYFDGKPHTLVHGDSHPGNVFWSKSRKGLTWIDFQLLGRAPPGLDLVQSMMLVLPSDPPDNHRKHVEAYHAKLCAYAKENGNEKMAEEYPLEECWKDYRWASVVYMSGVMVYEADVVMAMLGNLDAGNPDPMLGAFKMAGIYQKAWNTIKVLDLMSVFDEVKEAGLLKPAGFALSGP